MDLIPVQVKLAIAAAFLVVILGLTAIAVHYHSSWVDSEKEISTLKAQYDQLQVSADACSKGTEDLAKAATKKEEDIKKAQAQAAILAKSNESLAQALLGAKPGDTNSCKAAVKLYQEYKKGKEVK